MCRNTWIVFLIILIINSLQITSQSIEFNEKKQDKLVLYKIILNTYLTKIGFPKNNPHWRTRAQFGKVIGSTHDRTYSLYRLGKHVSSGANYYIETGRTDGLDDTRNNPSVLDSFYGSGILQGNGSSTFRAFFDNNHSFISMMSRITPSPNWFIGVDTLQLCVHGNWIDTFTIELDILGARTKHAIVSTTVEEHIRRKGFIHKIPPRYSTHPKLSFYHAKFSRLTPIATLTFIKLKEYTSSNIPLRHGIEKEFMNNEKKMPHCLNRCKNTINYKEQHHDSIVLEGTGADNHKYYRYNTTDDTESRMMPNGNKNKKTVIINDIALSYGSLMKQRNLTSSIAYIRDKKVEKNSFLSNFKRTMRGNAFNYSTRRWSSENFTRRNSNEAEWSKKLILLGRYENRHKLKMENSNFYSKGRRYKEHSPRDCQLSDWSAWSACSRSCGVGETQRARNIVMKSRRGGKPCEALQETKWCGSATPCPTNYKALVNFPSI